MTHRSVFVVSLVLCLFTLTQSPAPLWAEDGGPPPQKITTVEGITEYRLANGLQVLLFPDPSRSTVTVNVTYLVGSRHEGYGETGMAHLLEHLVFKGTPDHPQIWKALQDHGAQFNGSTWYDRTNYYETLPASDENLDFAIKLEADRMVNSFIARKDLDSEMTVVRNEFEMGENRPLSVLSERVVSTAYLWHNYGKSTIGSREDIERVPIDRLQAFYRKHYQPDNAVLVVAGKFDEQKTLGLINETFGKIKRPDRLLEKTYTWEPTQDGEREVVLRRVGDVQGVNVVYHICAGAHEDMAPVRVLTGILSADQTGRLYKALVEPQLATRVSASAASLYDPGYIEITAEVRKDQSIEKVREILLDVVEGLASTEITDAEVERAKNEFARRFDLMLNDSGRVGIRLSESAASGDWRLMFLDRDRMKKVTAADVKRVAGTYLKSSNRTLGLFLPTQDVDRVTVPPTPDVAALFKDYKGEEGLAQGEAFDATPANIEARTQKAAIAVGTKLALLPKKTRGERVNAQLVLHYGSETDLKGKTDAAAFIPAMLTSGTSKHSRRDIADAFDKLKANVRFSDSAGGGGFGRFGRMSGSAPGTLAVSIETTRPNLLPVLELVAECLRDSTFPAEEFEKQRKEALANLEQQLSEPMGLGPVALRQKLTPVSRDDVRYVKSIAEQIEQAKAVKLEDVKAVYSGLVGASFSEAAFVGDFDVSEITSALENLLVNWKSGKTFERIAMPYREVKPERGTIQTPDKANALFTLGLNVPVKDDDPDFPALFMANFIIGGNSNSRLLNRIRQKEGLSYGVSSGLQASPHEPSGMFVIGGICAPENAEKAIACAQEELAKLAKDGITQQELDDARKGYMETLKVSLASDGAVASMLAQNLYLTRSMKFLEERIARIQALRPDDVTKAAKKYLASDKLVIIAAGDLDQAGKGNLSSGAGQ